MLGDHVNVHAIHDYSRLTIESGTVSGLNGSNCNLKELCNLKCNNNDHYLRVLSLLTNLLNDCLLDDPVTLLPHNNGLTFVFSDLSVFAHENCNLSACFNLSC